jgi:ferrous iron transport protein B
MIDSASIQPKKSVPSCHEVASDHRAIPGVPVVALVGNPNTGKSSLFNAITGVRRSVGNWPGTTVEVGRGTANVSGEEVVILDFPGAYGLDPVSPDEALTRDLLNGVAESERPEVIVVTTDAATLSRSLYLLAQLRERPARMVIALTMIDVAAVRGVQVDAPALSQMSGCPVVPIDPRRGRGLDPLFHEISRSLSAPNIPARTVAAPSGDELALAEDRFSWVAAGVEASVTETEVTRRNWSDRIDAIVTAPVLGPLFFLFVMWGVFQVTTTVAAPMQEALDDWVAGPISSGATAVLDFVGLGDSWISGFVVEGLIAGVGMLLTFVPLMALMFVLLALLEDSGYLARAAVVTDQLMRRIGLPGRAFLPLIVGFGCNVPAISGTRVLADSRQRLLTTLLVPFTSCTARLTVYVLVATTFFGAAAGTVVFGMYVLSVLLVILVGLILRKTLIRRIGNDPLVIDLPAYHVPGATVVASVTWIRLSGFLRTASGIIVATVVGVWLLSSIPVTGEGSFAETPVEDSAYAAIADTVAPVFVPAGFGEWHAASALITGFVAKEAVISSWAQTYALDEPDDASQPGSLGDQIMADFTVTSGGHPQAASLAFLVFVLAYTPCVATLAAQKREIGLRWTLGGVGLQLVLAWVLAVASFQLLRVFL